MSIINNFLPRVFEVISWVLLSISKATVGLMLHINSQQLSTTRFRGYFMGFTQYLQTTVGLMPHINSQQLSTTRFRGYFMGFTLYLQPTVG
jgi:diaminopimelate decarboxylase